MNSPHPGIRSEPETGARAWRPAARPPHLPGSYLVIELTNRCSLACVHCSVSEESHGHHTETGFLSPVLFDALIADLAAVGARFDTLIMFWLGEPLLHPHFSRLWRAALRAAHQHGIFNKIEVHTNGTHLTPRRIQAALNDGAVPQVWHFSLDAIDRQTYLEVKGRDRYQKVQDHITAFLTEKARRGARWPRPVLQFIVGSNNASTAQAFSDHWLGLCQQLGLPARAAAGHVPAGEDVVLFFRQLDCPSPAEQDRENAVFVQTMNQLGLSLPTARARPEPIEARNLHPCSGFWKSPVISWRGELTACTRDNLLLNQLGSLREQSFSSLWWGPAMQARRAAVAQGNYDGLTLCQTCFIPRSLNYTALSPEDIAIQAQYDRSPSTPGLT